jgi:hypothetical protein
VKSGVIRGVVSLEESSLVVFCYLVASEIWSDKRGGISRGEQFSSILLCSPLERPPLLSGQISDAMRQQNTTKLLPSRETTPLIRSDFSSLVVFCYLSTSEIWRDKRGGLSRGQQFSSILLSQCM